MNIDAWKRHNKILRGEIKPSKGEQEVMDKIRQIIEKKNKDLKNERSI